MIVFTSFFGGSLNIVLVVVPCDLSGIFFELIRRMWVSSTRAGAKLVVLPRHSVPCIHLFALIVVNAYHSVGFVITLVRHIGHNIY